MVHRPLRPGKPARKIYIYRRGLVTPPRGWFPWGPLLYRAPPFSPGCPPFRFTLNARGDRNGDRRLPWDRHRVGHFLATLIRRVANTSGNFILPVYIHTYSHLSAIIGLAPHTLPSPYYSHSFLAMIFKYDFKFGGNQTRRRIYAYTGFG